MRRIIYGQMTAFILFGGMFATATMATANHQPWPNPIENTMASVLDTTPEPYELCDFQAILKRIEESEKFTIAGLLVSDDELWHCEQQIINALRDTVQ